MIFILDLAIDDLSIRSGICQSTTPPGNMHRCSDGTLIPMAKVSLIDAKSNENDGFFEGLRLYCRL